MKNILRKFKGLAGGILIGVLSSTLLSGQETEVTGSSFENAVRERTNIAQSIVEDSRSEAQRALADLRKLENPSGLPVEREVDQAFAAQDIAHRLLASGKTAAAEEFFKAAESALSAALEGQADFSTDEKVGLWTALAEIRGKYLKQPDQAQEALEQAMSLKPDDPRLKRMQTALDQRRGDRPQRGTPRG
jgi:tetratricopeptide (TPR) repeat protein